MLAADSHIRRLEPLDLSIQREQSLVLNMSLDDTPDRKLFRVRL